MSPQLDCLMHCVDKKYLDSVKEIQLLKKFLYSQAPTHLTSPRAFKKIIQKVAAKEFNQFITDKIYKNLQESQGSKLLIYKNNKTPA